MTELDWLDPETDDSEGADVCHHGVGFDTDCEWCDEETAEDHREARRQRAREIQPELPLEDQRKPEA